MNPLKSITCKFTRTTSSAQPPLFLGVELPRETIELALGLLRPKCGGTIKVVAFITDYAPVDCIIDHLKLRFIAEKRFLQILIENQELRPYIFAEVRDEDFEGLKSEPIFRIILDHYKKDKDLIFHELQKEIGPSLSRQLSQALLEKGNPPTIEEALDGLCAL